MKIASKTFRNVNLSVLWILCIKKFVIFTVFYINYYGNPVTIEVRVFYLRKK